MFIDVKDLTTSQRQHWLQYAVAPRPIALASTVSKQGRANLAPFSFFNLFSADPPIIVFSPARRLRDQSTKHTLENMQSTPEVVVHVCDYTLVQQVNITSADYPDDVDEFEKAGLTAVASSLVRPPRVIEAKVALECKVSEIKPLGNKGGAGNLVIAEILCMHLADEILTQDRTMIDPLRLQHVARMGGDDYVKVTRQNTFKVSKPRQPLPLGFDCLPDFILRSTALNSNQKGMLANCNEIPLCDELFTGTASHERAALLLDLGLVDEAWQVLLHSPH
jgi:flavin reductase (DIM6/NTAB) family NADH-FMN oxidoreductase RutF